MPSVRRDFKVINKRSDSEGNMLIVKQEPLYKNYKIYLSLVKEGNRERLIGEVDTENQVLLVKRDKSKHFHLKSHSYGFNREVIFRMAVFKFVLIEETVGDAIHYYMIRDKYIIEHGQRLFFREQGFELQVFLDYHHIVKHEFKGRWKKGKLIRPVPTQLKIDG